MKNRPEGRLGMIDQAGTCIESYHRAELTQDDQHHINTWVYALSGGYQGTFGSPNGLTLDQAEKRLIQRFPDAQIEYLRPVRSSDQ